MSTFGHLPAVCRPCTLVQALKTRPSTALRPHHMDDLTIEPALAEPLVTPRASFGEPARLGGCVDESAMRSSDPLAAMKPGSIGVRYRLKRRFRTYDAIACVPAYLAQTRAYDTTPGRDGERIHKGRSYAPVLVGDAPVEATDENLESIIRASVPDAVVQAPHPAIAERELHDAMRPSLDRYLLIDGTVWISI